MPTKLSEKDLLKIIALYEIRTSQAEIGRLLGVSGQIIGRHLRAHGIETCSGGYNQKRSEIAAKHEEIMLRFRCGEGINGIARAMRMSPSGVSYVI